MKLTLIILRENLVFSHRVNNLLSGAYFRLNFTHSVVSIFAGTSSPPTSLPLSQLGSDPLWKGEPKVWASVACLKREIFDWDPSFVSLSLVHRTSLSPNPINFLLWMLCSDSWTSLIFWTNLSVSPIVLSASQPDGYKLMTSSFSTGLDILYIFCIWF